MKRLIMVGIVVCVYMQTASAGEYVFCLMTNRVAASGKLSEYSNKQIKNGLCMTSKEVLSAIVSKNSIKENICTKATEYMMREFYKRFPGGNPESVVGRC